jgi:cullin 3
MVLNKFGQRLYSGLTATVTQHLRGVAQIVDQAHGAAFLPELRTRWQGHNKSMQMIGCAPLVGPPPATRHSHTAALLD